MPEGVPKFALPHYTSGLVLKLLQGTVVLAIISYIISISMAKIFANKNGYKVDDNQELLALGAANIFGSAFGAYPASGSLSRTALAAMVRRDLRSRAG